MPEAYIFDHVRTPLGAGFGGSLQALPAVELATRMLAALRSRSALDTALIEDVLLGVGISDGEQGGILSRAALLNAGFSDTVAGLQVSRHVMSGIDAIATGAARIMAGQCTAVIAGGVESMSRQRGAAVAETCTTDPLVAYRILRVPAGISADTLATQRGLTPSDLEAYAIESHRRAARAWTDGRFSKSVASVMDDLGLPILARDEMVRAEILAGELIGSGPAFAADGERFGYDSIALMAHPELEAIEHVHTAGTCAGAADGASGVLLADAATGRRMGLTARARVRAFASCGAPHTVGLTGAVSASRRALRNAGMASGDIDLFEVHEGFAGVALDYMRMFQIDHGQLNVNGGALAYGQALGAAGAVMVGIALDELERTGKSNALVALSSAGMGSALVIERVLTSE